VIARRVPQSPGLPLIYLVVAALAFVLAAAILPALAPALAGHYYHPRVLALVHTLTLGWITLTIMGASYQLMPILLEVAVASERLARWQLPIHVAGVIGIVGHFWIAEWTGFTWSAALVAVSILAHVANTAGAVARARPSFTARMMGVALAGLALTALFGTTLGADRLWRFLPTPFFATLHAHVQLALLGFVLPMVAGVAARVYPMFLLAPEPAGAGAAVQVLGIVGGVPVLVIGLLLGSHPAVVAGSVLVATAVVTHVHWVLGMTRAAKRPALDWSLRFVVAGALALVPTTVLGLGMAFDLGGGPRMAVTYGVLAIGGWASLTIVGMLLKIVPFLVWYRVYGPRAGREPVPMLAELSWPAAEAVAFWLLTVGIAALAAAVAVGDVVPIRIAAALVAAGALAFGATLAGVLRHLAREPVGTAVPKASGLTVGRG
jgi:hypothetical protein